MDLMIGGARGTMPWAEPCAAVYGGDTTSFMITAGDGTRIAVDGGTGLRCIQEELAQHPLDRRLLMLFTHYHLDHVMGLPSFPPLYDQGWDIELAAPVREGRTVGGVIQKLVTPPFWPIPWQKLAARIRCTDLEAAPGTPGYPYGALSVRWCALHHQDGCSAYRIDEPATGASVVIATDVEWALSSPGEREALVALCRDPVPAGALVFDSTYTAENYDGFRGWGHSTWEDGVALAHETGVHRLLLTHHARHDDRTLQARERRIQAICPVAALLRQGDVIAIEPSSPRRRGPRR
jgi:ribonuclease BN (tRNA processing enzyme)